MKAKKTIQLHSNILMVISCFMITWQASAQTFGSNRTGNSFDGWVINHENSNHWTFIRFQTSTNKAWNIVNEGDFWWGYDDSADHGDRGTEKMRLTTDGKLILTKPDFNSTGGLFFAYEGNNGVATAGIQADRDFGGPNNGGLQLIATNTRPIQFFTQENNLPFVDEDEAMRISGNGNVGIGTKTPRGKLDVDGPGDIYLVDNPNINSGPQAIFLPGDMRIAPHGDNIAYVQARRGNSSGSTEMRLRTYNNGQANDAMHIDDQGKVGINTTTPRGTLDVDGDGDIYLVDDPVNGGGTQILFAPGNFYLAPYNGSDISYIQAKRQNSTGSTQMRFRTFGNGQSNDAMHIDDQGNIGINNTAPTEKLDVDGTVKATSFVSSAASFPDYVFAADYKITPLSEMETYVKKHNHLPNMPSEKEVVEQGLNVPDVVVKSVENIETIYLHLIRMEKEIKALQQENATLKQQLKKGR